MGGQASNLGEAPTFLHGFCETSKEVLNLRRWAVVRMVRGRLPAGRLPSPAPLAAHMDEDGPGTGRAPLALPDEGDAAVLESMGRTGPPDEEERKTLEKMSERKALVQVTELFGGVSVFPSVRSSRRDEQVRDYGTLPMDHVTLRRRTTAMSSGTEEEEANIWLRLVGDRLAPSSSFLPQICSSFMSFLFYVSY